MRVQTKIKIYEAKQWTANPTILETVLDKFLVLPGDWMLSDDLGRLITVVSPSRLALDYVGVTKDDAQQVLTAINCNSIEQALYRSPTLVTK